MEFYEAETLDVLSTYGGNTADTGFVFESRRRRNSNTKPSNIDQTNVVAPTGSAHGTKESREIEL